MAITTASGSIDKSPESTTNLLYWMPASYLFWMRENKNLSTFPLLSLLNRLLSRYLTTLGHTLIFIPSHLINNNLIYPNPGNNDAEYI